MTDTSASIDDLLQHEEEPATRSRRTASGVGWWLRTAVSAGALTAVTIFGLRLFGVALPFPAILGAFVALLLLRRITSWVAPPPPARRSVYRDPMADDGSYRWGDQDALRGATTRWEKAFERAARDRDKFNGDLLPKLGELVDERLRQRHGLTRASDPERARGLLGDPLWKFLATPARRTPAPRDVAAVIAGLEKL